jgi:hypothetical protein
MAQVPADLKYTREHEWAKVEGDRARIQIGSRVITITEGFGGAGSSSASPGKPRWKYGRRP